LVVFDVELEPNDADCEVVLVSDLRPEISVSVGVAGVVHVGHIALDVDASGTAAHISKNFLFHLVGLEVLALEQLGRVHALVVVVGKQNQEAMAVDVL